MTDKRLYPTIDNTRGPVLPARVTPQANGSLNAHLAPPGAGGEVSLKHLGQILVRNKWLVLGFFALGVGAALVYISRAVPIYQAGTSIRVDEKRSKIAGLEMLAGGSTGSELATEMEVLRSRALAETVVDSLKLQLRVTAPARARRNELLSVLHIRTVDSAMHFVLVRKGAGFILNGGGSRIISPNERITLGPATIVLRPRALQLEQLEVALSPFQATVGAFAGQLTVSRPARDANVVVVQFQGPDPEVVRDVPNILAQNFILGRSSVKNTESRSTIKFLRQQLDTLSRQLAEAENSLQAFREGAHVVSLPEEATSQVQRLATLQAERASIDAERSALNSLLREVTVAAAKARPEDPSPFRRLLAFPTLLRNPAVSQLLAALDVVEAERTTLLIRRTAKDPDVITLTARVQQMEEQIRSLATTYLQGLTNQVASLDAEQSRFTTLLARVPAKEVAFARLVRQPKVLEGVYTMLQQRLKEAEIVQAVEDPSVRVVDAALTPERPIKPNKRLILMMGGMLGLMTGVGASLARESLDRKIRSREDVLRFTPLPVLGLIPRIGESVHLPGNASPLKRFALSKLTASSGSEGPRSMKVNRSRAEPFAWWLITGHDPRNPIAEAYRSLRTNIAFSRIGKAPRTLVFTSPMPGDGKSTTASNLAVTLAQQGLRVLLVDADLRRGALNEVFNETREPGLSNVIMGNVDSNDAIRRIELAPDVFIDLLPTGTLPPNPAELVGSDRMSHLLEKLNETYDTIILDSPPLNVVTDAALLGTIADGVLLIIRAGRTDGVDLEFALTQLSNVRAPVLGIALNDVELKGGARYGYGSYYLDDVS